MMRIIESTPSRWPSEPDENAIWGLVRIVIAQQISTQVACTIAERLIASYPKIDSIERDLIPTIAQLRALGLPERRAKTCTEILTKSADIMHDVKAGKSWEEVLSNVKGVGPWTIATFRIMVLRDPDVLPLGDVGLVRAFRGVYGDQADLDDVSEAWRPFRSVACWYLWRTLGNRQLG
jgi:DNA-3-methyladenine glycosylase II